MSKRFDYQLYCKNWAPSDAERFTKFWEKHKKDIEELEAKGCDPFYIFELLKVAVSDEITVKQGLPPPWDFVPPKEEGKLRIMPFKEYIPKLEENLPLLRKLPEFFDFERNTKPLDDAVDLLRQALDDLKARIQEANKEDARVIMAIGDSFRPWLHRVKKRRGPHGQPETNVVMFLMSEHFREKLGAPNYGLVADLFNDYGLEAFTPSLGGSLLKAETVKKRVEYVRKDQRQMDWARRLETGLKRIRHYESRAFELAGEYPVRPEECWKSLTIGWERYKDNLTDYQ